MQANALSREVAPAASHLNFVAPDAYDFGLGTNLPLSPSRGTSGHFGTLPSFIASLLLFRSYERTRYSEPKEATVLMQVLR